MHTGVLRLSQEDICGCERELQHALTRVLKLTQILESLARSLKIQSCLELIEFKTINCLIDNPFSYCPQDSHCLI